MISFVSEILRRLGVYIYIYYQNMYSDENAKNLFNIYRIIMSL